MYDRGDHSQPSGFSHGGLADPFLWWPKCRNATCSQLVASIASICQIVEVQGLKLYSTCRMSPRSLLANYGTTEERRARSKRAQRGSLLGSGRGTRQPAVTSNKWVEERHELWLRIYRVILVPSRVEHLLSQNENISSFARASHLLRCLQKWQFRGYQISEAWIVNWEREETDKAIALLRSTFSFYDKLFGVKLEHISSESPISSVALLGWEHIPSGAICFHTENHSRDAKYHYEWTLRMGGPYSTLA